MLYVDSDVFSVLQNFRRNKFTYYSSVLFVLRDKSMTVVMILSGLPTPACGFFLHHQF